MRQRLDMLLRATLLRYLGVSMVALGIDMGCFLALLRLGLPAMPAAALGYAIGMAVHWWLSAQAVFADGIAPGGRQRLTQKALFVGSALLGLTITTTMIGFSTHIGLAPRAAKILAVGASFAATYVLRSRVVFAPRRCA